MTARQLELPSYLEALPLSSEADNLPILVEFDGGLVSADLHLECILRIAKRKPWLLLMLPFRRLSGNAYFERRITAEEA